MDGVGHLHEQGALNPFHLGDGIQTHYKRVQDTGLETGYPGRLLGNLLKFRNREVGGLASVVLHGIHPPELSGAGLGNLPKTGGGSVEVGFVFAFLVPLLLAGIISPVGKSGLDLTAVVGHQQEECEGSRARRMGPWVDGVVRRGGTAPSP